MCNLSEGVYQRGIQQGVEKQLISSIKSVMTNLHLTMEEAMDVLEVDPKDRNRIGSMIL